MEFRKMVTITPEKTMALHSSNGNKDKSEEVGPD